MIKSYLWARRDGDYRVPRALADEIEQRLSTIRIGKSAHASWRVAVRLLRSHTGPQVLGRHLAIGRDALAKALGLTPGLIRGAIAALIEHGIIVRITVGRPAYQTGSKRLEPVLYALAPWIVSMIRKALTWQKKSLNQNLKNPKGLHTGELVARPVRAAVAPLRTKAPSTIAPPVADSIAGKAAAALDAALARISRGIEARRGRERDGSLIGSAS